METKSPTEIMADELLKRGNDAYEAREYLMAVHHFSEVLKLIPSHHTAYYNRSAALVSLKRFEEALNDAHLVTTLAPNWTPAYSRKAYVLWCMGEIGRALEAYEIANSMEPHDEEVKRHIATLQSILQEKDTSLHHGDSSGLMEEEEPRKRSEKEVTLSEDFECVLCLKVFYDPVTTPCGHTFCRSCLFRAMDHGTQCPLCRGVVHLSSNHPATVTLKNIIKRLFPDEYRQREEEAQKELIQDETCMPLFPLNAVVYPGMRFPMHIFEARYRLMLRRCMAGAKTFGLINIRRDSSGSSWVPYDVGCTLEINKINILPDGRSYIDTRCKRRFRVLEKWEMDGYLVGKIQYIDDENMREEEAEIFRRQVQETRGLMNGLLASGICETNEQIKKLLTQAGDMPTDDLQFSYWMSTILPVNTDIKQELLEMTSTTRRFARILDILRIYFGFSYNTQPTFFPPPPPQQQPPPLTALRGLSGTMGGGGGMQGMQGMGGGMMGGVATGGGGMQGLGGGAMGGFGRGQAPASGTSTGGGFQYGGPQQQQQQQQRPPALPENCILS